MSELEAMIAQAIELKRGDKEFALFYTHDQWDSMIGNTCKAVYIGEANPEFSATGKTPCESVAALISKLEAAYA